MEQFILLQLSIKWQSMGERNNPDCSDIASTPPVGSGTPKHRTAQDALRAGVAVRWGHGDEAPDSIAAGHALSADDGFDGIGIGGRASSGAGPPPEPFMIARSKVIKHI